MTDEPGIATALMDYAQPLMVLVGAEASPDEISSLLDLAAAVWNAVVLETTDGKRAHMTELKTSATKHASGKEAEFLLSMLNVLEKRKRAEDPMDTRIIRGFEFVGEPDGGAVLRVECQAGPEPAGD